MKLDNISTAYSSLESVAQQFEHWRATREKKGRIPDALWTLAASLAEQYSHNQIASALKINHAQFKKYALPLLSKEKQKTALFVECPLPIPTYSTSHCIVEWTGTNGSFVKVSGLAPADIQSLISKLLGNTPCCN